MKDGKGINEYHLNVATMINIMNKHLQYSTDQVCTRVEAAKNGTTLSFIITMDDAPKKDTVPANK